MSYIISNTFAVFKQKKIQGATVNSLKHVLLEDGKVKLGNVQTVWCGFFSFFPLFLSPPVLSPLALDGRHC